MIKKEIKSNLSADREHYRTKDGYKVALLECFGAKFKVFDASDPMAIVFECYYPFKNNDDCLAAFINQIHSGEPSIVRKFEDNLRNIYRIIRDIKQDHERKLKEKRAQEKKEPEVADASH